MNYSKLADLRNVFLDTNKKAGKGKKIIDKYQQKKLAYLLRHHDEEAIYDEETIHRDDVDYFLEYFSILSLAHVTGYLTLDDLQEDREEIIRYLTIQPLRKYYYEHYPLVLPQILLESLEQNKPFRKIKKSSVSVSRETIFHQFHALNQSVDNDDVDQLLWFLDNGYSYGYGLGDLKDVLKNTDLCFEARKRKDTVGQSVRGFFLYLDFLQQFDKFLRQRGNELDKSAYWIYHSYWFTRIEKQLRPTLNKFFSGLQDHIDVSTEFTAEDSRNRVNTSKKIYEEIFDRVIYNKKYDINFKAYLENWRNGHH
jgi:hypothetical protein